MAKITENIPTINGYASGFGNPIKDIRSACGNLRNPKATAFDLPADYLIHFSSMVILPWTVEISTLPSPPLLIKRNQLLGPYFGF